MQLLITLKGIEDLGNHLPKETDPKQFVWKRLWNFSEELLKELNKCEEPTTNMLYVHAQLPFDLQCLFKTFEVTIGQGIDQKKILEYWKTNSAVLLLEVV